MIFEHLVLGFLETNCYILGDSNDNEVIIIDPGDEPEKILKLINFKKFKVSKIIATHGHPDHIGGYAQIYKTFPIPLLINQEDARLFQVKETKDISQGDIINVGNLRLEVIHTPGHSPGSVCLRGKDYLITGDTLFAGGIGRTDLPGGSMEKLFSSIQKKLFSLPEDLKFYPGHGDFSTLKDEKLYNPFFR